MAHTHRVLRSIETDGGGRCVDLFVRNDGSFGFEEYRRDIEDGRGWFAVGFYADASFLNADEALGAALAKVEWLSSAIGNMQAKTT